MRKFIKNFLIRVRSFLLAPVMAEIQRNANVSVQPAGLVARDRVASSDLSKAVQVLLSMQYKQMLHNKQPLPSFEEVGFRVASQFDEDGIMLFIFALIGVTNKKLVDIGASTVEISNASNFIVNHGWQGLLLEGNPDTVASSQAYFTNNSDTSVYPPTVVQTWISAENINSTLETHGYSGSIDFLSIDIDGIDYWVWKALEVVQPRLVVVEYQAVWGSEKSVTVPNNPEFRGEFTDDGKFGIYCGASLAAFVKLGKQKGYRLIGCHRYGFNAFFLRDDVAADIFPEVSAESCFSHPFPNWAHEHLLKEIVDREWEEV
jgi:hypothetical protein